MRKYIIDISLIQKKIQMLTKTFGYFSSLKFEILSKTFGYSSLAKTLVVLTSP